MIESSPLDRRVGNLIAAYADRAPIDVDPQATAMLVASQRRTFRWWSPGRPMAAIGLVLVTLALVSAVLGSAVLVGAHPFEREPEDLLTQRVAPFIGLPPAGAAPSTPETGELVLSFYARVVSIGSDVHGMWLYADGRLIWRRNLEGGDAEERRSAFGGITPTTAILEQRLTPAGVESLLAYVGESTTPLLRGGFAGPNVYWGQLQLGEGGQASPLLWSDPDLPRRLANPGSWLPANAWADREVRGYVPTWHAACLQSNSVLGRLPIAAREILMGTGEQPERPIPHGETCYVVGTEDAQAIAGILDTAGFTRVHPDWWLAYRFPSDPPPNPEDWASDIDFIGILPHGDAVGYGS